MCINTYFEKYYGNFKNHKLCDIGTEGCFSADADERTEEVGRAVFEEYVARYTGKEISPALHRAALNAPLRCMHRVHKRRDTELQVERTVINKRGKPG